MTIVLDASAAIEIALNLENAKIFKDLINESSLVLAPNFYPVEITNVFWKYCKFGNLVEEKCKIGINCCIDLIDDFIDIKHMCGEVFTQSKLNQHPAYDMFYLVLARRESAILLSKDKKLLKVAKDMKINCNGNG